MSAWQGSDPRAPGGGMEALDSRRCMVGATMVYADRHGPYQFWQAGAEVPCICDGKLACKFHADRGTYDPAVWESVPGHCRTMSPQKVLRSHEGKLRDIKLRYLRVYKPHALYD